jgi:hypothetical protein
MIEFTCSTHASIFKKIWREKRGGKKEETYERSGNEDNDKTQNLFKLRVRKRIRWLKLDGVQTRNKDDQLKRENQTEEEEEMKRKEQT